MTSETAGSEAAGPASPTHPGRGRALRWVLALATTAVLVCAVGALAWWNSGRGVQHFSSCTVENGAIVLGWMQGSGDAVSTAMEQDGDEVVVTLRLRSPDGPRIAIGLHGEARYTLPDGPFTVRHSDGTSLDCTTRSPQP